MDLPYLRTEELAVSSITAMKELQQRVGEVDEEYVQELVEELSSLDGGDGDFVHPFEPVTIVSDGTSFYLADGNYRVLSYVKANIPVIPAHVYKGTLNDARRVSYGANKDHGKRRTNADKRKAVTNALSDEFIEDKSPTNIANICGVSRTYVYEIRDFIESQGKADKPPEEEPPDGKDDNVEAIIPAFKEILKKGYDISDIAQETFGLYKAMSSRGVTGNIDTIVKSQQKNITEWSELWGAITYIGSIKSPVDWKVCEDCGGSGDPTCRSCVGGVVIH